jgi:NitT/TauT family transport system ATP-binding protein
VVTTTPKETAETRSSSKAGGVSIHIKGLSKTFHPYKREPVLALDDINLTISDGNIVTLVGPSGCGKTTLLRIIGNLESASSGHVDILTGNSRDPITSTVFQEGSVFPWLNVQENVEYGLKLRGVRKSERAAVASMFIEKVGLQGFKRAYPSQLSGGMKQRVSVARAFTNGPQILLMDEPFASVDEQTRTVLQQELLRLWSEHQRTVVLVTHSIDEAIALSHRVIVMSPRPGRVIADIPVDLPRPRDVVKLRSDPHYGELYTRIWGLIRHGVE